MRFDESTALMAILLLKGGYLTIKYLISYSINPNEAELHFLYMQAINISIENCIIEGSIELCRNKVSAPCAWLSLEE
jgi:hypothetical protein